MLERENAAARKGGRFPKLSGIRITPLEDKACPEGKEEMKGCTFKRELPSGSITWGYSIDAGKDQNGKRKQIFKSGFARKADADAELRQKLNEKDQGELVRPDPTTFTAFLKEWFKEHADRNCTPKTVERYHQLAAYVLPHIGAMKLQDITALALERVF